MPAFRSTALAGLLRKSGKEGVDVWGILPLEQRNAPSRWRVVWLPEGTEREAAQRQADRLGRLAWGVVFSHRGTGPGVRVLADQFRQASSTLLGWEESKRLCAQRYIISDVPLGWGKPAMEATLAGMPWSAIVDGAPRHNPRNNTRSWFVRAEQPPPKPMIRHAAGFSPIQQQGGEGPDALAKKQDTQTSKGASTYVWRPGKKGKGKGKPSTFPPAWSDVKPEKDSPEQRGHAPKAFRQGPDLSCSEVRHPSTKTQPQIAAAGGLLPPSTDDPMFQPTPEDYAALTGTPLPRIPNPTSGILCEHVPINSDDEGEVCSRSQEELIPVLPSSASTMKTVLSQMAAMASAVQALQAQISQLQQTPPLVPVAPTGPLALAAPPSGPLALAACPAGFPPEPAAPPQSGRGRKVHIDGADPEARKLAEEEAKRRRTNNEEA